MTSRAPKIGFDRFIHIDWVTSALDVRAGTSDIEALKLLLDSTDLGAEAKRKTRTVLNRIWLEPRADLHEYSTRGIEIRIKFPDIPATALCWGMSVSSYPFFGKIAELIGRLSSLQGDCSAAEIHRRMSEAYGQNETTSRMTNMVIQSLASWGILQRVENGKRLVRPAPVPVDNELLTAWLIESAIRHVGKPIPISNLQSQPILFPFSLRGALGYIVSNSPNLEIRSEGLNGQLVSIRDSSAH